MLSCTDPDGFSCHEFYSNEAASAVRSTCVALGDYIEEAPCPTTYVHCCYHPDGSFGNPEMLCIRSSEPEAATWESDCNDRAEWTYCMR